MNKPHLQSSLLCLIFFIISRNELIAQNVRSFNQNSSRSNHTGLTLSFSPLFSNALNNSNDSLLFRGSGAGFRFGADYFFGKASIGFSSGFGSSSPDDATINNFLKRSSIPPDQLQITKSNQQNMYLLLGPSIKFGKIVELYAHAKGGLFINNSGLVSIQQRGALKAAYRNESTGKNIYPGFLTGLNVQYNTKSAMWSFGIGIDYMNTKSEVNNYDGRRGGGIEALKLSRNISDIVAGITIRHNIFSLRDAASGQSTGRRLLPTVNKREIAIDESGVHITIQRDQATGVASGKRVLPTVNKREIAIDKQGVHRSLNENCGPVTTKITNPDGSTEEMTFACTNDAAAYAEKINPGKQKNWLPSNFRTVSNEGDGRGIISGRLIWPSSITGTGVVTNKTIRGGSTTVNSQTTRTTPSTSFGTMVRLAAREAGSGMATGKKSREAGSGLATGKRKYEPIFAEGEDDVCNPCIVIAKSNPLYKGNIGAAQNNPLYQGKERTIGDGDCNDGISGIDVSLIDLRNDAVVAKTKTESCGDFFFANVPKGDYIVKINGSFAAKKGYDIYIKSKTDLAGSIEQNMEPVQLMINSSEANDIMMQKAGVSTSRSNIRTKSISIIEADLDGDGEFESLRANASFSDGSSRDVTPQAIINTSRSNIKQITIPLGNSTTNNNQKATVNTTRSNIKHIAISVGDLNSDGISKVIATGVFTDGSSKDVTNDLQINTSHSNIRQYTISLADLDGDGAADAIIKTKTKSNQSNDRVATGDVNGDGVDFAINNSHSNIKNLRVASGDVDGDGKAELLVGGFIPGGSVISAKMPGDPIPGLDVKLGKNPGQALSTTTTNNYGEFEFTNLETGDYFITMEQDVIIDDETIVTVGDDYATKNINTSEDNLGGGKTMVRGWNPTTKGNTKNINTSESNLKDTASKSKEVKVSASQNSQTLRSILIEADFDGDGEYETDMSNQLTDEITIDESGQILAPQMKAGVSTSTSNIRNRSTLQAMGEELYISLGKAIINNKEVDVRSVLKTKHDTVKNSINNVR
jgi:hypothetical protein